MTSGNPREMLEVFKNEFDRDVDSRQIFHRLEKTIKEENSYKYKTRDEKIIHLLDEATYEVQSTTDNQFFNERFSNKITNKPKRYSKTVKEPLKFYNNLLNENQGKGFSTSKRSMTNSPSSMSLSYRASYDFSSETTGKTNQRGSEKEKSTPFKNFLRKAVSPFPLVLRGGVFLFLP